MDCVWSYEHKCLSSYAQLFFFKALQIKVVTGLFDLWPWKQRFEAEIKVVQLHSDPPQKSVGEELARGLSHTRDLHEQTSKEKKERKRKFNEVRQLHTSSGRKEREILLNNNYKIQSMKTIPLYI